MFENLTESLKEYAPNIFYALIIFAAGYIIIRLVVKSLRAVFAKSQHIDETAWSFLISLIRTVLYVILCVMILSQLQVPMSSIVAALGTAGLAIGLALKDSLGNVAGGFLIMFNRPFKVGDYVDVKGSEGTVSEITILYTKLLTIDNKAIMIPNGTVSSATITNYTQEAMRRLELKFDISYDADFHKAMRLLERVISSNSLSLNDPDPPFVRLSEYKSSSIRLTARVWVKSENYWELRYALLAEIKDAFDREGIEIPYDQLDVHIDSEKAE
ncbi:MAG: mechanosensitive ion channel [Ruminococcus sp.]|nr:mechanosensitive ion channel [Ruminococcus sp.]